MVLIVAPKWPLRLQDGAASFIWGSLLQTDRPLEVLLEIDIWIERLKAVNPVSAASSSATSMLA